MAANNNDKNTGKSTSKDYHLPSIQEVRNLMNKCFDLLGRVETDDDEKEGDDDTLWGIISTTTTSSSCSSSNIVTSSNLFTFGSGSAITTATAALPQSSSSSRISKATTTTTASFPSTFSSSNIASPATSESIFLSILDQLKTTDETNQSTHHQNGKSNTLHFIQKDQIQKQQQQQDCKSPTQSLIEKFESQLNINDDDEEEEDGEGFDLEQIQEITQQQAHALPYVKSTTATTTAITNDEDDNLVVEDNDEEEEDEEIGGAQQNESETEKIVKMSDKDIELFSCLLNFDWNNERNKKAIADMLSSATILTFAIYPPTIEDIDDNNDDDNDAEYNLSVDLTTIAAYYLFRRSPNTNLFCNLIRRSLPQLRIHCDQQLIAELEAVRCVALYVETIRDGDTHQLFALILKYFHPILGPVLRLWKTFYADVDVTVAELSVILVERLDFMPGLKRKIVALYTVTVDPELFRTFVSLMCGETEFGFDTLCEQTCSLLDSLSRAYERSMIYIAGHNSGFIEAIATLNGASKATTDDTIVSIEDRLQQNINSRPTTARSLDMHELFVFLALTTPELNDRKWWRKLDQLFVKIGEKFPCTCKLLTSATSASSSSSASSVSSSQKCVWVPAKSILSLLPDMKRTVEALTLSRQMRGIFCEKPYYGLLRSMVPDYFAIAWLLVTLRVGELYFMRCIKHLQHPQATLLTIVDALGELQISINDCREVDATVNLVQHYLKSVYSVDLFTADDDGSDGSQFERFYQEVTGFFHHCVQQILPNGGCGNGSGDNGDLLGQNNFSFWTGELFELIQWIRLDKFDEKTNRLALYYDDIRGLLEYFAQKNSTNKHKSHVIQQCLQTEETVWQAEIEIVQSFVTVQRFTEWQKQNLPTETRWCEVFSALCISDDNNEEEEEENVDYNTESTSKKLNTNGSAELVNHRLDNLYTLISLLFTLGPSANTKVEEIKRDLYCYWQKEKRQSPSALSFPSYYSAFASTSSSTKNEQNFDNDDHDHDDDDNNYSKVHVTFSTYIATVLTVAQMCHNDIPKHIWHTNIGPDYDVGDDNELSFYNTVADDDEDDDDIENEDDDANGVDGANDDDDKPKNFPGTGNDNAGSSSSVGVARIRAVEIVGTVKTFQQCHGDQERCVTVIYGTLQSQPQPPPPPPPYPPTSISSSSSSSSSQPAQVQQQQQSSSSTSTSTNHQQKLKTRIINNSNNSKTKRNKNKGKKNKNNKKGR